MNCVCGGGIWDAWGGRSKCGDRKTYSFHCTQNYIHCSITVKTWWKQFGGVPYAKWHAPQRVAVAKGQSIGL
ncbi:hypothetical protein CTI12_AA404930 [Artemisia annua]|uniref:Uncharacterized protein n=1 Tax=Artemisia annua TaxID=35608 RepID=A0A2U1M932_ARTAN|nr:hypothetical protein CTI12_AA404930 [Artemisia annua]